MTRADSVAPAAALHVEQVAFRYAGRNEPALVDVSFTAPRGTITLVAGASGSGKSTLLRAIAGLLPPPPQGWLTGQVLDGRRVSLAPCSPRIGSIEPERAQLRVGLVLQSPDDQICTTTVRAELAFGLENACLGIDEIERSVNQAAAAMGLADLLDRRVAELSGGQKQRLVVASLLALRPEILLFDEPLSQLDSMAAAAFIDQLELLRGLGVTLIVAEHRLDDLLPVADRLLVLGGGRLTADAPAGDWAAIRDALASSHLEPSAMIQWAAQCNVPGARSVDELAAELAPHAAQLAPSIRQNRTANDGTTAHAACGDELLAADGLAFRYEQAAEWVWRDLSFTIAKGERVAVVGANGSGKSTLLAVMARVLRPAIGRLVHARASGPSGPCGFVPQNPDLTLFCRTVADEIAFTMRQARLPRGEIVRRIEAVAAELSLGELLYQPPQAASQGQRLRIAVAAVLASAPSLVLLDEPTTGQDPQHVAAVMRTADRWLRDINGALVFSTHDLPCVLAHATRVLVLAGGRLAADCAPSQLLTDDALLAAAALRRPAIDEIRRRLARAGRTLDRGGAEVAT